MYRSTAFCHCTHTKRTTYTQSRIIHHSFLLFSVRTPKCERGKTVSILICTTTTTTTIATFMLLYAWICIWHLHAGRGRVSSESLPTIYAPYRTDTCCAIYDTFCTWYTWTHNTTPTPGLLQAPIARVYRAQSAKTHKYYIRGKCDKPFRLL